MEASPFLRPFLPPPCSSRKYKVLQSVRRKRRNSIRDEDSWSERGRQP